MLRIDKSHAKTLSIFDPRLSWQDGVSSKTYLDPLFPVVEPSSYSIFHNISYLTSHVSLFVFLHNIYKPFHSHDLIGNYLDFFFLSLWFCHLFYLFSTLVTRQKTSLYFFYGAQNLPSFLYYLKTCRYQHC